MRSIRFYQGEPQDEPQDKPQDKPPDGMFRVLPRLAAVPELPEEADAQQDKDLFLSPFQTMSPLEDVVRAEGSRAKESKGKEPKVEEPDSSDSDIPDLDIPDLDLDISDLDISVSDILDSDNSDPPDILDLHDILEPEMVEFLASLS